MNKMFIGLSDESESEKIINEKNKTHFSQYLINKKGIIINILIILLFILLTLVTIIFTARDFINSSKIKDLSIELQNLEINKFNYFYQKIDELKLLFEEKEFINKQQLQKDIEQITIKFENKLLLLKEEYNNKIKNILEIIKFNSLVIPKNEVINNIFKFKNGLNYNIIDGKKVIKTNNNAWNATILGDKILDKNFINSWKIKINKSNDGTEIIIGIAYSDIKQENLYNFGSNKTFALKSNDLSKYIQGNRSAYGNGKLKDGDIIETIVNFKEKTLKFSVNGNNLGIAFDNISDDFDYLPYLELLYEGNEIELIESKAYEIITQ